MKSLDRIEFEILEELTESEKRTMSIRESPWIRNNSIGGYLFELSKQQEQILKRQQELLLRLKGLLK